jgi:hypothetical protein
VRLALATSFVMTAALTACGDGAGSVVADGGANGDGKGDDVASDAAPPLPDPCEGVTPACPEPGAIAEGSGLAPIDRCAFPMEDRARWAAQDALVDALADAVPTVTVADVLGDLNRVAQPIDPGDLPGDVPGVDSAFAWQSGDMGVRYWIPQGITGSGDGVEGGRVDGKRVLLVSWYYEQTEDPGSQIDKGVRIADDDASDPSDVRYRLVLLVEPQEEGGRASYAAVHIHAGGIAWVDDLLYVADTFHGFRVFDLSRILDVSSELDVMGYQDGVYHAHGYSYAVPQVGAYEDVSACAARFSFVALDRSSDPPSLLSGEYDAASVAGRLYRWPLAPSGRLQLFGDPARVIAAGAWVAAQTHVQGGLAHDDTFYLSSSKPAGAAGVLYRTAEGTPSDSIGWSNSPEDLSYDPTDGLVWSLSEGLNARYVFSTPLTAL